MKINKGYSILLCFLFSLCYAKENNKIEFSLSNSLQLGYDTNVLKYSQDEKESSVADNFFALRSSLQTYLEIFKRKTKIKLSTRMHYFFEVNEKSNFGYSLLINQPIGNYQHIRYNFTFIDGIYLREFIDYDYLTGSHNNLNGLDCDFDLIRYKITYQSPYINKKDKFEISIYNELQYYNPEFTEYDLNITGYLFKILNKQKANKFSITLGLANADGLYDIDGAISSGDFGNDSRRNAIRDYREYSFLISYDMPIKEKTLGVSFSQKRRSYLSELTQTTDEGDIVVDLLHYDRLHKDYAFNVWLSFQNNNHKNKIKLSYRNRITTSPYNWVERLKSFNKVNIDYYIYFNKIKFG